MNHKKDDVRLERWNLDPGNQRDEQACNHLQNRCRNWQATCERCQCDNERSKGNRKDDGWKVRPYRGSFPSSAS